MPQTSIVSPQHNESCYRLLIRPTANSNNTAPIVAVIIAPIKPLAEMPSMLKTKPQRLRL
jgi:hypothetical protein